MSTTTLSDLRAWRSTAFLGALAVLLTSCGASVETADDAALRPASGLLEPEEQDPFRFVPQVTEEERARAERLHGAPCEFLVRAVADGSAIEFTPTKLEKSELRQQLRRLARVFNAHRRDKRELTDVERLDPDAYGVRRLLELMPAAEVLDTRQGVQLVFRDPRREDVSELRARVRWYAVMLLPDPLDRADEGTASQCVRLPSSLEGLALGAARAPESI